MKGYKIILLIGFCTTIIFGACRKFTDPPLVFEQEPVIVDKKERKVLLVVIEGLGGAKLSESIPPTIKRMLDHSKYTFTGISDASKDASTWSSILSGQWSDVHNIHSNSFNPESVDDDDIHDHEGSSDAEGFVSLFQRVNETGLRLTSAAVGSSADLTMNGLRYADHRVLVSDDSKVKDSTVNILKQGDDKLALTVVEFSGVRKAGLEAAFDMGNPIFNEAVQTVDGYLGELLQAVEGRPTYKDEDWLIVVSSNHGGTNSTYGGESFEELNTFTIFYHPKFEKMEISADLMNFIRYHGWYPNENLSTGGQTITMAEMGVHAESTGSEGDSQFNIGKTGELTVEFKANFFTRMSSHPKSGYYNTFEFNHQNIVSKDQNGTTDGNNKDNLSTPGWTITPYGSGNYRVGICDGTTNHILTSSGRKNEAWQHVAVSFKREDSKTRVSFYIDGSLSATEVFDVDTDKIINEDPLVLGFQRRFNYGLADLYMADFRFWNKSLEAQDVARMACSTEVLDSDPLYSNLIAYYRSGAGGKLVNKKGNHDLDLKITGDYKIHTAYNFTPCSNEGLVPFSLVDIAPQIFYWLNIPTQDAWMLNGTKFLDQYEIEFLAE